MFLNFPKFPGKCQQGVKWDCSEDEIGPSRAWLIPAKTDKTFREDPGSLIHWFRFISFVLTFYSLNKPGSVTKQAQALENVFTYVNPHLQKTLWGK